MVGPWVGLTSRSPPTPTQEKVKERRERIMVEFEKMGLLLMEEKQRLLQALEEEEEETVAKLQKGTASLKQQSHSLERLLLQLEDRNERTPLQMLQVRRHAVYLAGGGGRGLELRLRCSQGGLTCGNRFRPTGKALSQSAQAA